MNRRGRAMLFAAIAVASLAATGWLLDRRSAELVGPARVIAGTDCGFGTSVGPRHVAASIAWAKLGSLVEGAALASAAYQIAA